MAIRKLESGEAEAAFRAAAEHGAVEAAEGLSRQDGPDQENAIRFIHERLTEASIEPGPEVRAIERELHERFAQRSRAWSMEPPPPPPVYFIPIERREEVARAYGKVSAKWGAYDPNAHLVFTMAGSRVPSILTARNLEHEFDHAYASVETRMGPRRSPEAHNNLVRIGLHTISRNGEYGLAAEEGLVALGDREYAETVLADRFRDQWEAQQEYVARDVALKRIPREQGPYTKYYAPAEGHFTMRSQNGLAWAAELMRYVLDEIPEGATWFEEARVTGNTLQLARAFEERFGTGSFRVFMALGFSAEDCKRMKAFLGETDFSRRNAFAEEILATRPGDLRKFRACIEREETVEA